MEKENKRIIYEATLIHAALVNEQQMSVHKNEGYSNYHYQIYIWYNSIEKKLNSILGFSKPDSTIDDFISYVSTIAVTSEQKRELIQLRKDPSYIKIMGKAALNKKSELENVLGIEITAQGMPFGDQNGVSYAYKTEEQLDQELNNNYGKLSELLKSGAITDEQYESYIQNLGYIYDYYISNSRGEQIPVRDLTEIKYEQIRQRAFENGVSFTEQFSEENERLLSEHEELQELQSQYGGIRR